MCVGGHFPGGPVVKTLPPNAGGGDPTPDLGAKIPHSSWSKKKKSRSTIVINSIKTKKKVVHMKKKSLKGRGE